MNPKSRRKILSMSGITRSLSRNVPVHVYLRTCRFYVIIVRVTKIFFTGSKRVTVSVTWSETTNQISHYVMFLFNECKLDSPLTRHRIQAHVFYAEVNNGVSSVSL